jgi:hypothetical protein
VSADRLIETTLAHGAADVLLVALGVLIGAVLSAALL